MWFSQYPQSQKRRQSLERHKDHYFFFLFKAEPSKQSFTIGSSVFHFQETSRWLNLKKQKRKKKGLAKLALKQVLTS